MLLGRLLLRELRKVVLLRCLLRRWLEGMLRRERVGVVLGGLLLLPERIGVMLGHLELRVGIELLLLVDLLLYRRHRRNVKLLLGRQLHLLLHRKLMLRHVGLERILAREVRKLLLGLLPVHRILRCLLHLRWRHQVLGQDRVLGQRISTRVHHRRQQRLLRQLLVLLRRRLHLRQLLLLANDGR